MTPLRALAESGRPRTVTRRLVGQLDGDSLLVNCAGSYDYLSAAYYVSQDIELAGLDIRPTCKDMLDAYVPPLFLEKATAAGLAVPSWYISNGYFEPPVIADPVNPFTLRGKVVWKEGRARSIARSLTRNYTYAICCQELPAGSVVGHFRAVLGWTASNTYRPLAAAVWEVFHIPLALIRVIRPTVGAALLSDISPLPFEQLSPREQERLEGRVTWLS